MNIRKVAYSRPFRRLQAARHTLRHVRHYISSQEWFLGQFAYGAREILIKYAALPYDAFLLGELQHGWSVSGEPFLYPTLSPLGKPMPTWIWQVDFAQKAHAAGNKRVHAIGAPWLYMMVMTGRRPFDPTATPKVRDQVLFVPGHRYEPDPPLLNLHNSWADRLESEFGSDNVIVMLIAGDFLQRSIREIYTSRGLRVETAGIPGWAHRFPARAVWNMGGDRTEFLFNLADLMESSTLMITDAVGTHIFYAASLGLPVLSWSPTEQQRESLHVETGNAKVEEQIRHYQDHVLGMRPYVEIDGSRLEEEARCKLGLEALVSPTDLASILEWRRLPPDARIPHLDHIVAQ